MVYFVFWGLLYLGAWYSASTTKKLSSASQFAIHGLLFTYFLILAGLRYKTGYDWQNYMPYFDYINSPRMFKKMEIGYALINYFFKNIFNSFSLMIFILALFCTCQLFKFCMKYSPYPLVSVFIYGTTLFLSYNMGLYRQSIAMAISFSTMHFLIEKKWVSAVVCFIAAVSFHMSAIITVFYVLCVKIHFTYKQRILLLFGSLFLNLFGVMVIEKIVQSFFSLLPLPDSLSKYSQYLISVLGGQSEYSTGIGMLVRMSILFIIFTLKENDSSVTNAIFNMVLVGCIVNAFARNIEIFDRLAKYFSMYEIVFFSYIVDVVKKYTFPRFSAAFFMIFFLYFFITPCGMITGKAIDGKPTWTMFSPWHSTIFKQEEPERIFRMRRSI